MGDEWINKHDVESHTHFSEFVFFLGYWSLRILATLIALKNPLIYIFYLFFLIVLSRGIGVPKASQS